MKQLIDKAALVAEIERRRKDWRYGSSIEAKFKREECDDILSFLDTLKVEELWKPADGNDLPEIDRDVIVLVGIKNPVTTDSMLGFEVAFAHRPNPDGWDGKNITTGEVEHYDVQTYDKGGWNIPNVKFWLDLDLPKMEE